MGKREENGRKRGREGRRKEWIRIMIEPRPQDEESRLQTESE